MKNVLILSDINFWEDSSGHRARLKALIAFLSCNVNLTVVNTGPAPKIVQGILQRTYAAEFHVLEHKEFMSSGGYGRRFEKLMGERRFDAVIIEYIHSSYFLNFIKGEPKIILDTHDIVSDRAEEFKKFSYPGALYELDKETEWQLLQVYDYVMAICGPDKKKLDTIIGPEKVLLCPHPVKTIHVPFRDEVRNITFAASAYLPNGDGINYFIRNCWPVISKKFPQIQLNIYGTVCSGIELTGSQNTVLKGFMPDLEQIYSEADIVINPVRFGAGLKIKNLEALAYGIPLITTLHGARGLERGINKCFLTANTSGDFIKALALLIRDNQLRRKLSEKGKRFIDRHFSAKKCFTPLINIIESD
jgi:glycosyltransferase involved in cell wall biosynthesis